MKCTKLEPGDLVLVRQKAFRENIKSVTDGKIHMIECIGGHLPVSKVQLVGETTRSRVLHRNLLFPLAMRKKSEEKQQNMEEKEPKLTDPEDENDASSAEQINNYEGAITRSKTKRIENVLLLKANILRSNHINDKSIHQNTIYSYVNTFFIKESDLKLESLKCNTYFHVQEFALIFSYRIDVYTCNFILFWSF